MFLPALYFILLLGGLVLFHEFGHFIVAKLCGIKVVTFSIGFPPAIFKKKIGETNYQIGAVLLGGYVRFYGDEPDAEIPENMQHRAFNTTPLWKRSLIVLAGPVANLILPFFVYFIVFFCYSVLPPSYIGSVKKGGPGWEAGIRAGDVIVAIEDEEVEYWWQVKERINASIGEELELKIRRGEEEFTTTVVPVEEIIVKLPQMNLTDREGRIQVASHFVLPIITVTPGSRAESAGLKSWDRVLRVDDQEVHGFAEFMRVLGKPGAHKLVVVREEPLGEVGHSLFNTYSEPMLVELENDGGELGVFAAELAVHHVEKGSKAEEVGLKPGDRLISIDDEVYPFWFNFEYHLAKSVEQEHVLVWHDGERERHAEFTLKSDEEEGERKGPQRVVFGAYNHSGFGLPPDIPNRMRVRYAMMATWADTYDAYEITLASVVGLVSGAVPIKEMGGPILIYQLASKTEEHGWEYFFRMMVTLSISLGIINLVPIPILDGGHLAFFAIEAVIRRPIPTNVKQVAWIIGLILILLLMFVVFKNDLARNWDNVFSSY